VVKIIWFHVALVYHLGGGDYMVSCGIGISPRWWRLYGFMWHWYIRIVENIWFHVSLGYHLGGGDYMVSCIIGNQDCRKYMVSCGIGISGL